MALKKSKVVRGIEASYWKIVDCDVRRGFVGLALYLNHEHAQVRENMLDGRTAFQIDFPIDEYNPLAYAYAKIKESKMETRVTEAIEEQLDEEGNVIVEAKEAVTEEIETNWFADSEDI